MINGIATNTFNLCHPTTRQEVCTLLQHAGLQLNADKFRHSSLEPPLSYTLSPLVCRR